MECLTYTITNFVKFIGSSLFFLDILILTRKQETNGLKVSAIMFSHTTVYIYNFKNVTIHN